MASRSRRRLLLVAQLAPPSSLVAARRVEGLAKYLGRAGFAVTVLTSRISGEGEIEGAERVIRTTDLMATRLNWRRGHFQSLSGEAATAYRKPSRLEALLVPDIAAATWLPFAAASALILSRERRFDSILTTSPAPSAHLLGLALHRRGIPWIAEFRDGWLYDRPAPRWRFGWQERVDAALEAGVVRSATAVVGVTEPIADDLRARFGVHASVITNGFDPEEQAAGDVDGLVDRNRHSLVYTGRLGYAGRSPAPLVTALRRLREHDPAAAGRLEVVFAGPLLRDEEELLGASDLRGILRTVGSLDRPVSLQLQRAADSLLVLASGTSEESVATAKLFEYFGARKPIVVLGDRSAAARIVEDADAGLTTSASDPDAIAQTLRRLLQGNLPIVSEEAVSRYAYPVLAERYAELIEQVCGR